MAARRRLDAELVRRGLAASRPQAATAVEAGPGHRRRRAGGRSRPARRRRRAGRWSPARRRASSAAAARSSTPRSTGSASTSTGARVLDAGASTGGFTDCLLQRGAAHVVAVDVGHGQLHETLRADARVAVLERTNVRDARRRPTSVARSTWSSPTCRSSRSARSLPACSRLARPGADLVLLVKPQFEAGRPGSGEGRGVVRGPGGRTIAVRDEIHFHLDGRGAVVTGGWTRPYRAERQRGVPRPRLREGRPVTATPEGPPRDPGARSSPTTSGPKRAGLARRAATWLQARGHEAWVRPRGRRGARRARSWPYDRSPAEADLAVSLGGDGTMLRAVDLVRRRRRRRSSA